MNVVYALTRNVYEWIRPSITSLTEFNPDVCVFILCEDDEFPFELPVKAEIINISDQNYFPNIGEHRQEAFGGFINQLKVCYPSLLPVDKVIHLDIDTIICDKLDGLWDTDVEGKWFAAVPESQTWYRPFGDKYYNMGVALFNLDQLRKDKMQESMIEYLTSTNQPFADQNAWNKFAYDNNKAQVLNLRYNESRVTGMTANPAIVHYCSYPGWWVDENIPRIEYLKKYQ